MTSINSVRDWLEANGFSRFVELFEKNEIDVEVLNQLTNDDLKELGLPLGARKKLLSAIAELGIQEKRDTHRRTEPVLATGAERRQLTVMFCDLADSTALAGQMDAEEFRDVILAYQEACTKVIKQFDGFIARYFGDGMLVYFGYPQAHEDDAERAVCAGLAVVESIGKLSSDLGKKKNIELAVRVGIATGPVVVGDIVGEGASQESTVLGETPNLAARLQSLASPNSVVIAPATQEMLGKLFTYEDLGQRELKGIAKPVNAWKVTQEGTIESRFEAIHAEQLTPLVGRDEELDILLRRWERAKSGEGQVVLISGEAGIGKSRITQALRQSLHNEPLINLQHQCSPYHTNSALYPVINRLERAAGLSRDDTTQQKLDKLEALLMQATEAVPAVAPLFAALLSIPSEDRYPPSNLSPEQQKDQILAALNEQLYGLAAKQPLLCIFEDLHWIDPTTHEYIDSMLTKIDNKRILGVLTYRPEFQASWAGEANTTSINLNKLPQRNCAVLIQNITRGKKLPEEVAQQVIEKTDGVPLFVEELTKTVLELGLLREERDRYVLDGPLPPLAIPTTLQDSLMARLDRLAGVKEVAQIGAVIGREFGHDLIHSVANLADAELDQGLDKLLDAGLLFRRGTPPDANYTFKHAMIQDTAYGSLLKSQRRQLHAKIAQTVEEHFPTLIENQPELAAHHFSEAGLTERALEYWHKAGKQASQRSANVEASRHLSAALGTLAPSEQNDRHKLDLLVESIAPVSAVKGYSAPELESIHREALAVCERLGDTPQIFPVLYARWLVAYVGGQLPQALGYAQKFLDLAQTQKAELPVTVAQRCIGNVLVMRGDPVNACQYFQPAINALDDSASDSLGYTYGHDTLVAARSYYALALCISGYPDQARTCYKAALDRARLLDHAQTLVVAHALAGGFLYAALRDADALASHAKASVSIIEAHPMAIWAVAPKRLLGYRALLREEYEKACTLFAETLTEYESLNYHLWRPVHLCHLAESYAGLGDFERALESVDRGFKEIDLGRDSWYEAELNRVRGRVMQAKGEPSEMVETCYQDAIAVAKTQSAKLFELRAATDLARYWQHKGETTEARELLEPVHNWFTEGFDIPDLKDATALLKDLNETHSQCELTRLVFGTLCYRTRTSSFKSSYSKWEEDK